MRTAAEIGPPSGFMVPELAFIIAAVGEPAQGFYSKIRAVKSGFMT